MRFKKSRDEEVELSIAPLIDIVFLLLIFFMVTSHFDVASGIHIQLPKIDQKIFNRQDNKLTLVVDKSGRIYLKGKKLKIKSLQKRLQKAVKERASVSLIIQADKKVMHGRVVQIMDIAKKAGVHSLIIAAQWKAEKVYNF